MHDKGRLSTDRSRPVIKATDWRGKLVAIVGKDVAEYCIAEFTKRNHAAGNNPLLKTHANSVIRTLLIKYTDVTVRTILQVFEIGMGRYQKIKKDACYSVSRGLPTHKFTSLDMETFTDFFKTLQYEPRYACAHRRQKM